MCGILSTSLMQNTATNTVRLTALFCYLASACRGGICEKEICTVNNQRFQTPLCQLLHLADQLGGTEIPLCLLKFIKIRRIVFPRGKKRETF